MLQEGYIMKSNLSLRLLFVIFSGCPFKFGLDLMRKMMVHESKESLF